MLSFPSWLLPCGAHHSRPSIRSFCDISSMLWSLSPCCSCDTVAPTHVPHLSHVTSPGNPGLMPTPPCVTSLKHFSTFWNHNLTCLGVIYQLRWVNACKRPALCVGCDVSQKSRKQLEDEGRIKSLRSCWHSPLHTSKSSFSRDGNSPLAGYLNFLSISRTTSWVFYNPHVQKITNKCWRCLTTGLSPHPGHFSGHTACSICMGLYSL